MVTDTSSKGDNTMHQLVAALDDVQLNRAAALGAVAAILEGLACLDSDDPQVVDDADARLAARWPMQAELLVRAAGTDWAGPLLDAAVELRRHADQLEDQGAGHALA